MPVVETRHLRSLQAAEWQFMPTISLSISQTKYWNKYDPFQAQKQETFRKSSQAIFRSYMVMHDTLKLYDDTFDPELATTMHELEQDKAKLASDAQNLNVIFKEMIQMCLW